MKATFPFFFVTVALLFAPRCHSQGTFQNLDFESANLSLVPSGQFGTFQPISNALPFWTAYLGTNQITQILHNNFFLGTATVSILGPEWTFTRLIDGAYTVILEPGVSGQDVVDVSIAQTGLIPLGAQSIRFKSDPSPHHFGVSIGDDIVPVFLMGTNADYFSYGADITIFGGLTRELRITAFFQDLDNRHDYLDSISFSNQPIPEPSLLGLFALGSSLLGWRLHRLRRP